MTRFLLTGLIVLAALLPVAPLLLVVFLVVASLALPAVVRRVPQTAPALERRLALLHFEQFRGPPSALARF